MRYLSEASLKYLRLKSPYMYCCSLVRRATQLVEGGEVSNEQQSGSSLGSIIKDMRAFVESDDRQATLQMLPNDVAPKQQDSSALKPFHPFPISALLPKTRVGLRSLGFGNMLGCAQACCKLE